MDDTKCDILSLSQEELKAYLHSLGEPAYRATQLFTWLHRGYGFAEMTNLPASLREKLAQETELRLPQVRQKHISALDGTVKYLFGLIDGECVESVFMRYEHGSTVCISSQAGCRMGCRFCASTLAGRVRDLTPSEMLGQVLAISRDLGERISGVVMMGIGEPLDNYANTVKFLRLVSEPDGICIGLRHVSVSTCGLADRVRAFAEEGMPVTLSVSLHASDDETRSAVMPINQKWSIASLLDACRYYYDRTGRRVSYEYALISGKNDAERDADALAALLKKHRQSGAHVNLIPLNPVAETGLTGTDRKSAMRFAEKLRSHGINATVRRTLGADIGASCGQLRRGERNHSTPDAALSPDSRKG